MADGENFHALLLYAIKDAVDLAPLAVKELADPFFSKSPFESKSATAREFSKALDCIRETIEPL